ncbi:MotA/TolQ/ExbB proton channel family protein [Solitalea canadensis]|uniref:Biopolymer transport protein n=1 Tax=Solitalea canadensis (strain ATCC 29591 / DSM 3403 / JCM 21819 / LMG 8368 / NBRC 15130 / NCIMB 12057 / USAM 9D) TaxID=929556 RepID=H8KY59_SOLCM|nr:MotA/TolQ/ExbB proton channel family protein [Solitalea canadensis]AFD05797.1 biopolymer transport protein [Solitalea canadensis DSM 3403]
MFLLQITDSAQRVVDSMRNMPINTLPKQESLSLMDLVAKGGWVMIPLAILLFLALFIFFERYFTIRKANKTESSLMIQIRQYILSGNVDAAISVCKNNNTPIARMLQKGLVRIGKPIKEIEGSIENVGKLEVSKLEKNINILGIIAGIAPMLGFVGTISGVIRIFYNISLAGEINIGLVSGGLYEKMITSAAGLIIGIFAYIGHHILTMMVDRVILKMETDAIDFIDLLEEPTR